MVLLKLWSSKSLWHRTRLCLKTWSSPWSCYSRFSEFRFQVAEYTARQIKQSVVGYGAADKEQVQMMVMRLLNLTIKLKPMQLMLLLLQFVMPTLQEV